MTVWTLEITSYYGFDPIVPFNRQGVWFSGVPFEMKMPWED